MHEDENEHLHLGGEADPAVYIGEHIRLRSAGIDIGSSTSHLVFSELVLVRQGRQLSSRFQVVKRELTYRSRVILTPYASATQIDTAGIGRFIEDAYRDAGLARSEIDTGAVITTGEAAMKENAGPLIQLFAADAGKFVCATAGPNLESLLAAHGSGAAALSREPGHPTVLNVDIGGGTTKFAVCRNGRVLETAAIHAGARLLAWDADGVLRRVEERGRGYAREAGAEAAVGHPAPAASVLDAVADRMASLIVRVVGGQPLPAGDEGLWITDRLGTPGPFSHLVFSGGVAEYIYGCETAEFGDLGPRLARALLARCPRERIILQPVERIRATCIGASQYTVQVSGNTIFLSDEGILPVRNVPVAAVRGLDAPSPERVAEEVRRSLRRLDLADGDGRFALAVHWHHGPEYAALSALCRGIVAALPVGARHPLLLVIDADVAGLVGRILRDECGVAGPVACIDQVALREFDYVDIGSLMPDQYVVPVVVKSLVFR